MNLVEKQLYVNKITTQRVEITEIRAAQGMLSFKFIELSAPAGIHDMSMGEFERHYNEIYLTHVAPPVDKCCQNKPADKFCGKMRVRDNTNNSPFANVVDNRPVCNSCKQPINNKTEKLFLGNNYHPACIPRITPGKVTLAEPVQVKRIEPWDIWEQYELNALDAGIIDRVLMPKPCRSEYEEIIKLCQKRISQIDKHSEPAICPQCYFVYDDVLSNCPECGEPNET